MFKTTMMTQYVTDLIKLKKIKYVKYARYNKTS